MGFNDQLFHYGIKGMRWGIRRTAEELGHITEGSTKGLNAVSNLRKRHKSSRTNPEAKSMTDDELRRVINRMNLEKQYSDLTKKDTSAGFETVKDILAVIGSISAITVAGVNLYASLKYGENPNENKKDK